MAAALLRALNFQQGKPLLERSVPRHLTRDCPGLSDHDYLRLGLLRTLRAEGHWPRLPRYPPSHPLPNPGLIVLLYRRRWDPGPERSGDSWQFCPYTCQQKVHDQFKTN